MKQFVTYVAALFAAATLFASVSPASAQAPKKMRGSSGMARGIKSSASRGANSSIKRDEMKANAAGSIGKAKSKMGGSRGTGNLHFDNQTGVYVRCYVDGDYVGTMGPGGDLYDYESGYHTMYCVALFDDGSTVTWGPFAVDAPYHLYVNP